MKKGRSGGVGGASTEGTTGVERVRLLPVGRRGELLPLLLSRTEEELSLRVILPRRLPARCRASPADVKSVAGTSDKVMALSTSLLRNVSARRSFSFASCASEV